MARTLVRIIRPHLLLCEGADELSLAGQLLENLVPEFHVHDCGGGLGIIEVIDGLELARGFSDLTHVIVICDAETDAVKAREAVARALVSSPAMAALKYDIIVLPEGQPQGALEDVVVGDLCPVDVLGCVSGFLDCISQNTNIELSPGQRAKARLRTWLAVQEPTKNPAHFIKDGHFDLNKPGLTALRERILAVTRAVGE